MLHTPEAAREWHPTPYPGIHFCWLWRNSQGGGHALLKLERGSGLPCHRHPGWEQIHLLTGHLRVNETELGPGDHLLIATGEAHRVTAWASGVYLSLSETEGVEIL